MSTTDTPGGGSPRVFIVNGPNLNALGRRDPRHYGVDYLVQLTEAA